MLAGPHQPLAATTYLLYQIKYVSVYICLSPNFHHQICAGFKLKLLHGVGIGSFEIKSESITLIWFITYLKITCTTVCQIYL